MASHDDSFPEGADEFGASGDPNQDDAAWNPDDEDTGPLFENGFDQEELEAAQQGRAPAGFEPLPDPSQSRYADSSEGKSRAGESVRAQAASEDAAYVAKREAIESVTENAPEHRGKDVTLRLIVSAILIALVLGAGFGAFKALAALKEEPEKIEPEAIGQVARVTTINVDAHHEVIGAYASVTTPLRTTTSARVAGEIIWIHPKLEEGAILSAGDPSLGEPLANGERKPLFVIDPRSYQLALDQAQAQKLEAEKQRDEAISARAQIDVELASLPVSRENINAQVTLALEAQAVAEEILATTQDSVEAAQATLDAQSESLAATQATLDLGKKQLKRLEDLLAAGDATEEQVDAQRVVVSNQESAVVSTRTAIKSAEAQLVEARNRSVSAKSSVVAQKISVQTLRNQLRDLDEQAKSLKARRDSASSAIDRAEASVARVAQAIASAELNLAHTEVYAPFPSARVRTIHARLGDYVAPGSPLFLAAGGEKVEIEVRVPADRRFGVRIGSELDVLSRPLGERVVKGTLKVARLSPIVDPNARTRTAYVEVYERDMLAERPLQPGEMVYVELKGRSFKEVYRLPRSAEVENGFFVARDADEAQKARGINFIARRVGDGALEVVARTGEFVLVRNAEQGESVGFSQHALKPGDRVIVSNLDVMVEGMAVRPVEETQSAPDKE